MSNFLPSREVVAVASVAIALGLTGCKATEHAELETPTAEPTIAEDGQTVQDMLRDYCGAEMTEDQLLAGQEEFGRVNNSQNPTNPQINGGGEYVLTLSMCPDSDAGN